MNNDKIGTIERIFCNTCRTLTNHELVYSHERELTKDILWADQPTDTEKSERWTYLLWICMGCETATLQEDRISFDGDVPEVYEPLLHPNRAKENLPQKAFLQLDEKLARIYREIIESFNADARTLCAIGLRALLEGICAEKEVEGKTLFQKIDGLTAYLPANIVESLHRFRFTGNEAVHELQAPSREDLASAIEVMEDLLNFLYDLDYKARLLFAASGLESTPVEKPDPSVIRRLIERKPALPQGQKDLYRSLYLAGDQGASIPRLVTEMGRTESQIYGVLGALGRRINNTEGVEGAPGIGFIFEYVRHVGSGEYPGWGWKMRPELREVLSLGDYAWTRDWAI
jgi:hypothetical protein